MIFDNQYNTLQNYKAILQRGYMMEYLHYAILRRKCNYTKNTHILNKVVSSSSCYACIHMIENYDME